MPENTTLTLSNLAARLSRAEILAALSSEELLAIAGFCREETYHEGDIVLAEGDQADKLVIVENGKLALEKRIQIGRHSTPRNATIGYVTAGQMAGFSTLTSPFVYSTSVVSVEVTRCISMDGVALRAYLKQHPAAGYEVMEKVSVLIANRYRQAIHTLTYFLSIVSHELRSPMAAVENYLQTMLGGYAGETTPKQERMMKRCILRLTDLRSSIGDVVDLARMRPEQIQADFEWFDPGEVGTESIEDVRLAATEKEISIVVDPPPKFELVVGARRRMRQVFTNLLTNAIRYSPQGSTVIFRARYKPEVWQFEVEDAGPGIPADELPYIFDDFFRASNVEETGMGLGLSIARKIVEAHHGQILVEILSADGERTGTRFTVVIPRDLMTPEMQREKWLAEAAGS